MAVLKSKDIKGMKVEEKEKKLKELKLELIKSRAKSSAQGTSSKTREIKKAIARLLTLK
jgi:ribosomal protein L29